MKYLVDIDGLNHYQTIELAQGESKEVTYTFGNVTKHAVVKAGKVLQEPTSEKNGKGFVYISYVETRNHNEVICTIAKL